MSTKAGKRWYEDVKDITTRLVGINSISPNVEGENACAAEIYKILAERGLQPAYWKMKRDGRKNVWTMLEGSAVPTGTDKIPTIVLIGHLDTGDIQDYGSELNPFSPQTLQEVLFERYKENPDTEDELLLDAGSQNWMFGRGSLDMKSGIAAQIAVMGALAKLKGSLPGNVVMVTTFDEEVESAGIMAAVEELVKLRQGHNLDYIGVINSDYTAPREPGDDNRYIYRGTIGKLLPCFYIRGCETHVGEAFRGLDANLIAANLIQETNLNVGLCDEAEGEITVPPVTQKQRDSKVRYDAQTPISSVVYCSVLTHSWTPQDVLVKMVALASRALSKANHKRVVQWSEYARRQNRAIAIEDLGGRVWTYQQLYEAVEEKLGHTEPDLKQQLEERAFGYVMKARQTLEQLSQSGRDFLLDNGQLVGLDSREKSLIIVKALVEIASREKVIDSRKPAIVVYFAPPFFPPVSGNRESRLNKAIAAEMSTGAYGDIQFRVFYP
ncbi:MAG TPA: M20/M25/M40 family metallo-hydrolase, partial [Anaerolineae bacterium]|nr:M20/M25/M40 family metallo-hydrolase [Anaerolineae bacterium]